MELNEDLPFALQELRSDETVHENAIETLSGLLIDAVEKRVDVPIAIAFSGGVDSTLLAFLCTRLEKTFTLYTVGLEGSKDLDAADAVAHAYGWPLKKKILKEEELENIFKEVIRITKKHDPVTVGVGAVMYTVMSMADEDVVLTGLGSEEIFAGYERHKKSKDVNEECWNGLRKMYERDLIRDNLIAGKYKINFLTPFLDEELIKEAMSIPGNLKLNDKNNKLILREISSELLGKFALRKKKAAQYGSSFIKGIDKLARLNNFKYMKDYLTSL